MSLRMTNENNLPHELLLTERQKTRLKNAFNNNMSTDVKLSKAQISKIIQSGGFLGSLLSKLAGPLMKVPIPVAKNILGKGIVRAGYGHPSKKGKGIVRAGYGRPTQKEWDF